MILINYVIPSYLFSLKEDGVTLLIEGFAKPRIVFNIKA